MDYLALALVAGLAAVERKGFLQAMLSRPVVLAPLAGCAMGDPAAGLLVAAPLELLWLGAVNLGAALPAHEALGTAAVAGGAVAVASALRAGGAVGALVLPAAAAVAFLVCAPLSVAGRRAERLVERFNERLYALAERDLAAGDVRGAARVNLYGLGLPFAISAVLAPLGAAAAGAVGHLVARAPVALPWLALGWAALAALACAAAAKALRAARARLVYLVALGLGLGLAAAAALAGGRP